MKNVINWKTMSKIGVKFGSAFNSETECDIDAYLAAWGGTAGGCAPPEATDAAAPLLRPVR
jgi:hypothetical protein